MSFENKLISAEFIARSETSRNLIMGSMPVSNCGCKPGADIKFNAQLTDFEHSETQKVVATIPTELPEGIEFVKKRLKDGSVEYRLKNEKGKESKGFFRVTEFEDPTGKYLCQQGQYESPDGDVIDFVLWTDPEPFTIVAICAVACVVILGIDLLFTNCQKELAPSIKACTARGGVPVYHAEVTLVVDPFDVEFGCSYHCEFDACQFPTKTSVSTTTTTTTTTEGGTTTTTTTTETKTPLTTDQEEEEVGISSSHYRRRLLSNRELRKAGVDAHAEKDAVDARPNSRFDLYIDTNNDVWVIRKEVAPRGGENIGPRDGLTY